MSSIQRDRAGETARCPEKEEQPGADRLASAARVHSSLAQTRDLAAPQGEVLEP